MKITKQTNGEIWVELADQRVRVKLLRDCRITQDGLRATDAPPEVIERFVRAGFELLSGPDLGAGKVRSNRAR